MDSTAVSLCKDNNLPILVFSIEDPVYIYKAVCGEKIGTIVTANNLFEFFTDFLTIIITQEA